MVPGDAVMDFSYDMELLHYQKFTGDSLNSEIRPHQQFGFVPQRQKMHVQGYLLRDGKPYLDIRITEKTNRPWLYQHDGSPATPANLIDKIVMDGDKISSFDQRGGLILNLQAAGQDHKQLADAILRNIDPVSAFHGFLEEGRKKGWDILETDHNLIIRFTEGARDTEMLFLKDTGLPIHSVSSDGQSKATVSYKYECIDGKYVLVMQRTSVVRTGEDEALEPLEYVSAITLDNIVFNH